MCWKTILQRQRASYLLRCACACMAPTPPCFRIGGFLLLLSLTFEHGCCAAQANEVVRVMEKADGWWFCSNGSSEGWYGLFLLFPASLLCIFSRDNHYCPCINCVTVPLSCTSLCYHLFLSPSLSLFFFLSSGHHPSISQSPKLDGCEQLLFCFGSHASCPKRKVALWWIPTSASSKHKLVRIMQLHR